MSNLPVARYANRNKILALGSIPLLVGIVWGVYHLTALWAAAHGKGSPMALVFALTFLLLWWVPLSWKERPFTATPRQQRQLDALTVTVHLPVYNEDPSTLRDALQSVLDQSRLPTSIHVVDDGSNVDYSTVRAEVEPKIAEAGINLLWRRTPNRGKRHAQMETLASDTADIYVTLDSDSTLDTEALREGLMPFSDPKVMSVAGMVVVWNSRKNFLTRLTCMLYTPFTRGFRPAQSLFGRVMVNSGTLAFYRGDVVREMAGSYENEQFRGRPMQMNDDSMLTFYAMLKGRSVHQPTSVAFTIVPERFKHYFNQQLRWMRGTFVRTAWWFRYMPLRDLAWWMPLMELVQLALALVVVPIIYLNLPAGTNGARLLLDAVIVGVLLNYLTSLRYFVIERSDESGWMQFGTFLLAPLAGVWRMIFLRPLIVYAAATVWKVSRWGTREQVEVTS
jgi:hyaluronan synthase